MSPQQHIIKRQIVQIGVPDQNGAHQLQQQLSRIYRNRLVPIIDKCCSQLSDPDRIHRVDSLDVDLGSVDLENLEEDLVARFTRQLPELLAARIRDLESMAGSLGGATTQAISQLELVALFARTGSLPWWADLSRPQLLAAALRYLVRHAPGELKHLVRELASEPAALQRIIHQSDDVLLAELHQVLLPFPKRDLAQLPQALLINLPKMDVAAGSLPTDVRKAVWHAVLFTAALRSEQRGTPVTFCREVLLQIAGRWRIGYASLIAALRRAIEQQERRLDSPLGKIVQALHLETVDQQSDAPDEVRRQLVGMLDRLQRDDGPLAALFALLRPVVARLSARIQAEWLAALRQLDHRTSNSETLDTQSLHEMSRLLRPLLAQGLLPQNAVRQWLADFPHKKSGELPPDSLLELVEMVQGSESDVTTSDRTSEALILLLQRLQHDDGPLATLFAALRPVVARLSSRIQAEWLAALHQLDHRTSNSETLDTQSLQDMIRLLRPLLAQGLLPQNAVRQWLADLLQRNSGELPPDLLLELVEMLHEAGSDVMTTQQTSEALISLLQRLQHAGGPLATLFAALRPVIARLSARSQTEWLDALRRLDRHTSNGETVDTQSLQDMIRLLRPVLDRRLLPPEVMRECLPKPGAAELSPDVLSALSQLLKETAEQDARLRTDDSFSILALEGSDAVAAGEGSQTIGEELLAESGVPSPLVPRDSPLGRVESEHSLVAADERQLDLQFSDADELFVSNAGLVVLSPFLGHFFELSGLLHGKQFKDAAARQRAVGLLGFLATEDPTPAEYLLPLGKVLCGMALDDVFDFGQPVTDEEAEQCADLVQAAIVQAPILGEMSLAGFRGTFLLRQGVLSSRDGAWLLRVERETYDVVLDRFPWTFEWIKLPWMEAPLRVEW